MAYGGFWIRFLAYVVDSLIVTIAAVAISLLSAFLGVEMVGSIVAFLLMLLYWPVMQASEGQATYGKALLGLKVTGYAGERISFLRSLARELSKIISAFALMIGFLLAGFTKRKQALHDFVASTYVVRASPGHVVAGLAVTVLALFAPVIVVLLFGAGMFAAVMGGMAAAMMGGMTPEVTVQAPKPPPAPPTAPQVVAKPQPPVPPPAPQAAVPAPAPKPVPVAAPGPMAQATAKPAPAKEPVKAAAKKPAKPVVAAEETAKPAARPRQVPAPQPTPPSVAAPTVAAPTVTTLRFNDLVTAVLYRDTWAVNDLLAFGKWPDKPDSRGMTPLMLAAMLGDSASAEALLKAGANPNRTGPGGDTAVSIARERRDAPMQALLQRYGAR